MVRAFSSRTGSAMIATLSSAPRRAAGLIAAVSSLILASPVAASARLDSDAQVDQICTSVVGLAPGEKHFAACEQSLADSLRGLREAQGAALTRRDCRDQGYRPGTAGLAECELASAPANRPRGADLNAPVPGGSRSYFLVSRDTAFRRDELACAKLGFDPAQSAFTACASDLRGALARASAPAM
jgi:hypothetical protein